MSYDGFLSRAANVMKESPIRLVSAVGARVHDLISFAPGYPDPATFPWEQFRTITGELLAARTAASFNMDRLAVPAAGRGARRDPRLAASPSAFENG
jgi:hypothetical protein